MIAKVLTHLGLSARAPPRTPAQALALVPRPDRRPKARHRGGACLAPRAWIPPPIRFISLRNGCNFTKLGCSVVRTSPPCNARRVPLCLRLFARRGRPRCGNGSTGVPSLLMPGCALRLRIERDWKARAKDGPVWRAEDAATGPLLRPPPLASEHLTWVQPGQRLAYSLPKPRPDGQIVALSHPLGVARPAGRAHPAPAPTSPSVSRAPRPYAPLRVAVTARAGLPVERPVHDTPLQGATEAQDEPDAQPHPRAGYLWAMLLARI